MIVARLTGFAFGGILIGILVLPFSHTACTVIVVIGVAPFLALGGAFVFCAAAGLIVSGDPDRFTGWVLTRERPARQVRDGALYVDRDPTGQPPGRRRR